MIINSCTMIRRTLESIVLNHCYQGKIILIMGARQVGKTTLLRQLVSKLREPVAWLNLDEGDLRQELTLARTSTEIRRVFGQNHPVVILDEAQQIPDIGRKLKLFHDTFPEVQIIASGSSAFDLQNSMHEPLTGRKLVFHLFPLSYAELRDYHSVREEQRLLIHRLIFGAYPEVVNRPGNEKMILQEISSSYLYKDILQIEGIRKSSMIEKLLIALALQLGQEVKYHELASLVGGIDPATVEKYLDLLERTYVIFKLPALSRNLRNELKKGKKYYFYDNGIRNVLINNFQEMAYRLDKGALWENYLLAERRKLVHYRLDVGPAYFWRTHDQAEIDYLEEKDGYFDAYEIKWKSKSARPPASFAAAYPQHRFYQLDTADYDHFLIEPGA